MNIPLGTVATADMVYIVDLVDCTCMLHSAYCRHDAHSLYSTYICVSSNPLMQYITFCYTIYIYI